MEIRDIKDFFRELKESRLYQDINPVDLDNEQVQLDEITGRVEEFVLERFLETFPCANPDARELAKSQPYDKAYATLTEYIEMPKKLQSVKKLMREVVATSEKKLPVWYKEEGKRYFKDSHIYDLLEK